MDIVSRRNWTGVAVMPREHIGFNAGVEAVRRAALTAAVTIEIRDDASDIRQQAAIAALQGPR